MAYLTAFHLQQYVRLRRLARNPRASGRHVRPLLTFGAVLALLGVPLLVLRPWLLVAVAAALPFFAVNTLYTLRNRERALVNGLVAVVPACAVLLVALLPGRGLRVRDVGLIELGCSAALLATLLGTQGLSGGQALAGVSCSGPC